MPGWAVINIGGGGRNGWLVTLALIGLAAGCSQQNPVPPEEIRPVKTVVVAEGPETYVRVFPGRVEASKSVELAFQVPGLIVSLPVKEGQKVARDQLIAQLRQDEFQARREASEGELDQGRAALAALRAGERTEEQIRREAQVRAAAAKLANTRTEFNRYARLLPAGAVSRAEYELAETSYRVAQEEHKAALQLLEKGTAARKEDVEAQEGRVRTLQARLAEVDVQLADSTLRAPYNGVIGWRLMDEGQYAAPNKPVVQFQSVDQIDIIADVPEAAMAAGFRPANIARMIAEFPKESGLRFPLRVKEVAQVADPVTQTFQVRFTMKATRRIAVFPGMTATVAVTYRQPGAASKRMLVPVSAVVRKETGQQVVWIVGPDDVVRSRVVKMGNAKDGQVEILAGLKAGERIAAAGAPFLREGMKVRDLGDALGGSKP